MARKIPNWVFIDTETNEACCKRCGQRERPPLPATISTFVKWCEYFGDKHKGCAIAGLEGIYDNTTTMCREKYDAAMLTSSLPCDEAMRSNKHFPWGCFGDIPKNSPKSLNGAI
jgi:hypothetical protein